EWIQNGYSFGTRPRRTGELFVQSNDDAGALRVVRRSAAVRDAAWNGIVEIPPHRPKGSALENYPLAGRTLRTPTFTLESGILSYQLRGGCHVAVCVDSHRLVKGPLHGEIALRIKPNEEDAVRWVRHSLERFIGSRIHVEFTTREDDPLEIVCIVDGEAPDGEPLSSDLRQTTLRGVWEAPTALAESWLDRLDEVGDLLGEHRQLTADDASVAQWAASNCQTLAGPGSQPLTAYQSVVDEIADKRQRIAEQIRRESRVAMAMIDGTAEDDRLLIRGNHKNVGPQVPRRFLEALGGRADSHPEYGSGRLELARQITDPSNPLTYRVIVNRVWHHLFGAGIVSTVDNFGVLGTPPSHPELLDYLASRFVEEDGRSLKNLIRRIVLSDAYRMSSRAATEADDVDPDNRLLHRFPVRRLEAEALRDAILAVSGRLDRTSGGPSVPTHLTAFMDGRGRPSKSGPLDGDGRRSIYQAVRRNFLAPMMTAFDAPTPFSAVGRRNASNVPAQALILLNDPFVVQQAAVWGRRLAREYSTGVERIEAMYLSAFARRPTDEEREALQAYTAERSASGADAEEIWSEAAHILFNAKEFSFVF
ncbi:MAG: DUF1553 domain-containing protein, partial [Planctomycetota bacterium]